MVYVQFPWGICVGFKQCKAATWQWKNIQEYSYFLKAGAWSTLQQSCPSWIWLSVLIRLKIRGCAISGKFLPGIQIWTSAHNWLPPRRLPEIHTTLIVTWHKWDEIEFKAWKVEKANGTESTSWWIQISLFSRVGGVQ